jgi:hypothetical protein
VSWLKKLIGGGATAAAPRVRVCVECGQPVDRHSDWCAIYRTQQELDRKRAGGTAPQ